MRTQWGVLVAAGFLALAQPSFAQQSDTTPLKLKIALTAMMAAQGADLSTTMHCIGANTCREGNPLFAPFVKHPAAAGAWKMGVSAGTSWLLLSQRKQHPKLVFWTSIALTGFYAGLAIHNSGVVR